MNYSTFHKIFLLSIYLLFFGVDVLSQENIIEEVFVTAEKRSESLQDISQAVTALSDEDIESKNIESFVDLSAIVPGVTVAKNEGYKTAKKNLEQDGFIVKPLLLLQTGEVPEDASVLVVAGPKKPVQAEEQNSIQSYLDKGGAVMMLVDPKSKFGMEPFLKNWGVLLGGDIVIDPMSKLFGGDFAAPVVNQYTVHDITREFVLATIFPIIQSVRAIPGSRIQTVELLKTSENSWGESDFESGTVKFDAGSDLKGPIPVAVVATKLIGAEKPHKENEESHERDEPQPKATLIVIGDSDFSTNRYSNFSGNGDFFLNTVSWLAEEDNLISIRPKERKNTPVHITRAWGTAIFILGLLVFPGLVAGIGIRIWWKRRGL